MKIFKVTISGNLVPIKMFLMLYNRFEAYAHS